MENTTYSFLDVSFTISHGLLGQKSVVGQGIGKINIAYSDNLTDSELGADESVMITKVNSSRGTVSLQVLQTSSVNKWLINAVNTLRNADASVWAQMSIVISELFDNGLTVTAVNCAPVKRADREDAQKGGYVTWEFFSPHITEY